MDHEVLMTSSIVTEARLFACEAHKKQKRRYTFEPYSVHLKSVACMVASVTQKPQIVAAAWLHDIVEDTPITLEDVGVFGFEIKKLVFEVTDHSSRTDGNRAARKKIDLDHARFASPDAQTIKLADLIDNADSIIEFDPNFAKIFMAEGLELFGLLTEGDPQLFERAENLLNDYFG